MKNKSTIWATLENLICLIAGLLIGYFNWQVLLVIILVIIATVLILEGLGNE